MQEEKETEEKLNPVTNGKIEISVEEYNFLKENSLVNSRKYQTVATSITNNLREVLDINSLIAEKETLKEEEYDEKSLLIENFNLTQKILNEMAKEPSFAPFLDTFSNFISNSTKKMNQNGKLTQNSLKESDSKKRKLNDDDENPSNPYKDKLNNKDNTLHKLNTSAAVQQLLNRI